MNIVVKGIDASQIEVTQFRIDQKNSNAYEEWKTMGSPQAVTAEQYKLLEGAGKLKKLKGPETHEVDAGSVTISTDIGGQAVAMFLLEWK